MKRLVSWRHSLSHVMCDRISFLFVRGRFDVLFSTTVCTRYLQTQGGFIWSVQGLADLYSTYIPTWMSTHILDLCILSFSCSSFFLVFVSRSYTLNYSFLSFRPSIIRLSDMSSNSRGRKRFTYHDFFFQLFPVTSCSDASFWTISSLSSGLSWPGTRFFFLSPASPARRCCRVHVSDFLGVFLRREENVTRVSSPRLLFVSDGADSTGALPGWGSWHGPGIRAWKKSAQHQGDQQKASSSSTGEAPGEKKKVKRPCVILNQKLDRKAAKYFVSEVW